MKEIEELLLLMLEITVGILLEGWWTPFIKGKSEITRKTLTYCLVGSREANVLLDLWRGVTCLKYESHSVALRKDWLLAWVIS